MASLGVGAVFLTVFVVIAGILILLLPVIGFALMGTFVYFLILDMKLKRKKRLATQMNIVQIKSGSKYTESASKQQGWEDGMAP